MVSDALRRAAPVLAAVAVLAVVVGVAVAAGTGRTGGGTEGSPGAGSSGTGSSWTASSGTGSPGTGSTVEPTSTAADQRMSRFTSVTWRPANQTLEVRFWGGVQQCYAYAVRAQETATSVRLTLVQRRRDHGPCIELAREWTRQVRLTEPLGNRRVLDAATGEVLPVTEVLR